MDFQGQKITINHNLGTHTLIEKWAINDGLFPPEPERVSVEYNNLSYSLVFDKDNPRVEMWNLDEEGEIKEIIQTITLPIVQ